MPIVLANGLGGPVAALRPLLHAFARTRRVIAWDYRGLYGSAFPGTGVDVSIHAHARDVSLILEQCSVERAAFLGWSMGVQVGLELVRRAPEKVGALILLNGAAGLPLEGLPIPGARHAVPRVLSLLSANPKWAARVLDGAVDLPGLEWALKSVGWIRHEFPSSDFRSFLSEFKTLDLPRYFELFRELTAHDARDVLPLITAPTLVLGSEHDFLTPETSARRLAAQIRGARYRAIPRASHYAAAEAPAHVVEHVAAFLADTVDLTEPRPSGSARAW